MTAVLKLAWLSLVQHGACEALMQLTSDPGAVASWLCWTINLLHNKLVFIGAGEEGVFQSPVGVLDLQAVMSSLLQCHHDEHSWFFSPVPQIISKVKACSACNLCPCLAVSSLASLGPVFMGVFALPPPARAGVRGAGQVCWEGRWHRVVPAERVAGLAGSCAWVALGAEIPWGASSWWACVLLDAFLTGCLSKTDVLTRTE